ncbi:PDC sensor domain-containing protein, partial [Falsiroseomonas oryzae]|uniref:hypothetical protein n=1 Tax=Falsiroseomonas oryzae TaxID=2766473 RepID=UPI0022EB4769
ALLAALVALPVLLMVLGAWAAWRNAWTAAEAEVAQAAEAVAEYGLRVLGAHAAAAGRVDALLRGLPDEAVHAREAELHRELRALVAEMPQAEAAYVIDRDGAVLLSANIFPVPRAAWPAADRDFFLDLRADGAPAAHVSRVHTGRLDDSVFFAVSRRRTGTGNADLPPGAFEGVVNLSVYPNRLAEGLRRIMPRESDVAVLIRADGEVLARSTGLGAPVRLPPAGPFAQGIAGGAERAAFMGTSVVDGVRRLYAVRRIEGWPVYAQAAR